MAVRERRAESVPRDTSGHIEDVASPLGLQIQPTSTGTLSATDERFGALCGLQQRLVENNQPVHRFDGITLRRFFTGDRARVSTVPQWPDGRQKPLEVRRHN